jgi:hypothetical protein
LDPTLLEAPPAARKMSCEGLALLASSPRSTQARFCARARSSCLSAAGDAGPR